MAGNDQSAHAIHNRISRALSLFLSLKYVSNSASARKAGRCFVQSLVYLLFWLLWIRGKLRRGDDHDSRLIVYSFLF